MKRRIYLLLPFFALFLSCRHQTTTIKHVSSTKNAYWVEKAYEESDSIIDNVEIIEIFKDSLQQKISGFGCVFNELGWEAMQMLPARLQDSLMQEFFVPGKGFNFNICRMPIGANDYAKSWYSLNDSPGDFSMDNFNIDRDKKNLIPYIKMAMQYKPDLKVWGSPWCPPAWMKHNNHYACKPDVVNDLSEEGRGEEGVTQFIMEPEYLQAYALYFEKYVNAYRAEGINIYAVHVQNEMNSCQKFPSCIWTSSDLATFIGDYLGPQLENMHPSVDIWYGTFERPYAEMIDTAINHPTAGKFIKGVGFQWAGKHAIPVVNKTYPEMDLMQTESECGNGSNDWAAAEYTWSLIKHYFEHGVNSYMYWNPILDESGKSQWGWKQNSLISVDTLNHTAQLNPEYYLFKHVTHFVPAGAYKIKSYAENISHLAFLKENGELVVVLVNTKDVVKTIQLKMGKNKPLQVEIEPKSFNTLVI